MTSVISNPPYNLNWKHPFFAMSQPRFFAGLPPESNANYAFILTALDQIDSKAVFLLPNGVLTTSNKDEKAIRQELIKKNLLKAVVAIPDHTFESTGIPTSILLFNKHKTTANVVMVNGAKLATEVERKQRGQFGGKSHTGRVYVKKINVFEDSAIEKIKKIITDQTSEVGISKSVSIDEIEENDWILTPTRYIDLPEHKTNNSKNFKLLAEDLERIEKSKGAVKLTINRKMAHDLGILDLCKMLNKSADINKDINKTLKEENAGVELVTDHIVAITNSKTFKIEVKEWDKIPDLIATFAIMWSQMMKQYNNQENIDLMRIKQILLDKYFFQ